MPRWSKPGRNLRPWVNNACCAATGEVLAARAGAYQGRLEPTPLSTLRWSRASLGGTRFNSRPASPFPFHSLHKPIDSSTPRRRIKRNISERKKGRNSSRIGKIPTVDKTSIKIIASTLSVSNLRFLHPRACELYLIYRTVNHFLMIDFHSIFILNHLSFPYNESSINQNIPLPIGMTRIHN